VQLCDWPNDFQVAVNRSVGIAMGYRLDGPGLNPSSARFFSTPQRLD
jgi:hypothetical protein